MDSQKDLQKTEGTIKFLDYQTLKSSPFGDNRVGERAYRRAERLASGVVLLTNHIDDRDPLKQDARQSVLNMLSHILAARDEMRSPNSPQSNALKMSVRKIISAVRLLGVAGHISFQNADIMTEALDELLSFMALSRRSSMSETISLSREDLIDARELQRFMPERSGERPIKTSQSAEQSSEGAHLPSEKGTGQSLGSRSQAILEVLRSQGELGIKDVVSNLPEYSEKMIQRELAELVAAGRVKKTGLKRWSRYTYIEEV